MSYNSEGLELIVDDISPKDRRPTKIYSELSGPSCSKNIIGSREQRGNCNYCFGNQIICCCFFGQYLNCSKEVGPDPIHHRLIRTHLNFLLNIIDSKDSICSLFEISQLSDRLKDDHIFEEIQGKNKPFNFTQLYSNLSCLGLDINSLIGTHDSVLMEKYFFGKIMGDIMLLLKYIPIREPNSKINTEFDASGNPSISIMDYFSRISEFSLCSPSLFVLMLIYIKRILDMNPSYIFDSKSAHRMMLATLVISIKLYDDKFLTNSHYAYIGGVTETELSKLETIALILMDFRLIVTIEEFIDFSYSLRLIGEKLKLLHSGKDKLDTHK
ncbi:Cyclin 6 pcl7 [Cryptosporidium felis]|nr:Cyclin 6 pcl7 [Cryptosporidium felis]